MLPCSSGGICIRLRMERVGGNIALTLQLPAPCCSCVTTDQLHRISERALGLDAFNNYIIKCKRLKSEHQKGGNESTLTDLEIQFLFPIENNHLQRVVIEEREKSLRIDVADNTKINFPFG